MPECEGCFRSWIGGLDAAGISSTTICPDLHQFLPLFGLYTSRDALAEKRMWPSGLYTGGHIVKISEDTAVPVDLEVLPVFCEISIES